MLQDPRPLPSKIAVSVGPGYTELSGPPDVSDQFLVSSKEERYGEFQYRISAMEPLSPVDCGLGGSY